MADAQGAASVSDAAAISRSLRSMRGALDELAASLGGPRGVLTFQTTSADRFAAAADVLLEGQVIGQVGVLSEAVQKLFDLQAPVLAAELDLPPLLALHPPQRQAGALPRYPGIERDLSVIVADDVRWQQIESEVRSAGPAMLESLAFIDAYRGKPIPQGRKSVTLRMVFRDAGGTLRHDQVDSQVGAVISRLKSSLHAELRG
jgi:phenylalanyl-tRNA synthetase beta chain